MPQSDLSLDHLLTLLQGVYRRADGGAAARCPAHEDDHSSLSVSPGDKGILLHCFAGCTVEAITAALGLSVADLYPAPQPAPRPARVRPSRALRSVPEPPSAGKETAYHLFDPDGSEVAVKVRIDYADGSKDYRWQQPDGKLGLNGRTATSLPLCGSETLAQMPAEREVVLVEGEKAALSLLQRKVLAVGTVGGAASTPDDAALAVLRGHHVILWPDHDEPGRQHMRRIAERLADVAASLRVVDWPAAPPAGDAADVDDPTALIAAAQPYQPTPLTGFGRPLRLDQEPDLTAAEDEWLVEGFLRPGALAIIGAPIGIGKSQVRLEMGLLLARGEGQFLGHYPVVSGPTTVLTIDAENGVAEEWRRTATHLARLGLAREGLPYYRAYQTEVQLERPESQAWLSQQVADLDVGVLILDSISALHGVREVREDLLPIYRFLRSLIAAHPRLSIVLVHHLKKPGTEQRSSERVLDDLRGGLWGQVADVVGLMSPMSDRRVHWRTWKRVAHSELILLQTDDGPLTFLSEAAPVRLGREDRVLAYIDAGATTVEEIETAGSVSRAAIYRALTVLRRDGILDTGTPLRRKPEPTLRLMEDER